MMKLKGKPQDVFRVSAKSAKGENSVIGYALTFWGAQALADIIVGNGFTPLIQPMKLVEVPTSELRILQSFRNGKE